MNPAFSKSSRTNKFSRRQLAVARFKVIQMEISLSVKMKSLKCVELLAWEFANDVCMF